MKDNIRITEPLVSVIMPVLNGEKYIEDAICSVLGQTYSNFELIVVDDGSVDATSEIITKISEKDNRIKCIKNQESLGTARSRNIGLEIAEGDYICFLDADDLWKCDKLHIQMNKLTAEDADLVYTSYSIINDEGQSNKGDYIVPDTVSFEKLLKENVIGCSTVMITRKVADKYRFVEDYYHEDYCLWLNILRDGYKAVGCTEVLVEWRLISNSRSFDKRNSALYRWKIYRDYLSLSRFKSINLFMYYVVGGIKKYYS